MGLKLYPSEVQSFASEISANVAALAEQLENSLLKIEDFEGEKELDGVSWGGTKQQLASHKYVIRGILAAGDMMSEDARRLAADVGDEILDEDVIQDQLYTQQQLKEEVEQGLQYYRYRHGQTLPDGTVLNFGNIISSYTDVLNTCIAWIQTYHEKLERLYAINSSTGSLFQRAIDLFNAVSVVNAAVIGSWNGKEFTAAAPAEAVAVIMGGWANTRTGRELRRAGITMEQIQNMEALGYTPEGIVAIALCCETEDDRKFLENLMEEDYIRAFAIPPGTLSDSMSIVMADYAAKVAKLSVVEDGCKKLQEFNNAIYQFEKTGHDVFRYSSHSAGYLSRLYSGSQILLEVNTRDIIQNGSNEEKKNRSYILMAASSLWGSQYSIINGTKFTGAITHIFSDLEMKNLKYDEKNHAFSFSLSYEADLIQQGDVSNNYGPERGEQRKGTWEVAADVIELGVDVTKVQVSDTLRELNEQKDKLATECFVNGITNATIAAISVYNPAIGLTLGMIKSVLKEDWGSIDNHMGDIMSEINQSEDTRISKTLLNSALEMRDSFQEYHEKLAALDENIKKVKDDYWLGVFGSGGYYIYKEDGAVESETHLLYTGVYNPDTLEKMVAWEKKGLAGLDSRFEDYSFDTLSARVDDNWQLDTVIKDNAIILLNGGDIMNMDPEEFTQAAMELQNIVRGEGEEYENWTIDSYFNGGIS